MRSGVELKGLDALVGKLKRNANLTDVKNVVKINTSELQRGAQRRSPVDTGTLKRSINQSLENGGFTGRVSAGTEYAPYIEWGTRFIHGRRYMGTSYFQQRQKFIKDLKRIMR